MIGDFVELYMKIHLKVNADKSKMIVFRARERKDRYVTSLCGWEKIGTQMERNVKGK